MQKQWHAITPKEALESFSVGKEGLTSQKVERTHEVHGFNELPSKKADPWWKVLFQQFTSPLIVILILAAVLSALIHEWVDAGVIMAAVVLNTIIGFVQEFKANKALEHLRSLVQPHAMVIRDGKEIEVEAREIVPGDILVLRTGDQVTADARIIELVDLHVNEAALTGESMPIEKQVAKVETGALLAERVNMVYAGTNIVGGRGLAIVVATGFNSELGKIAALVEQTEETDTPLQEQLVQLARWVAIIVTVLVVLLFLLGISRGEGMVKMFEMSVALAVAAIPEGLVVSVTIILAIGMQRILKRRSLVRRLVAVETLGSVSIICSDKTGTITEGEMRVTHIATTEGVAAITESKSLHQKPIESIWKISGLCNDAKAVTEDGELVTKGSPTERALLQAVIDLDLHAQLESNTYERLAEIPFDSAHKYMVTRNRFDGSVALLAKGAPTKIFGFCQYMLRGGRKVKLADEEREAIEEQVHEMTQKGLRLIAFALKDGVDESDEISKDALEGFTFLGFVGLRDPLRAEAKEQIAAAKRAGVQTVVITGDHPETARAIGAEAGLVAGPENVVIGSKLDEWTDAELEKRVKHIRIYARVEPRHKIRIVKAWQARGEVVAMTGDGVNDAPALKAADIGIAVGAGTEVAKQASDVVILNNDLGTITSAIEEGRVIFDNIRKTTVYLMSGSFTEIILIGAAMLMGLPIPLLPVHILWINLVADSFPNAGLTLEPAERDVMNVKPRPRGEPVLNRDMITITFLIGIITASVLIFLYVFLLGMGESVEKMRTIMFAAVGIDTLIYVFAVKSFRRTIFRINPFSNLYLLGGIGVGFGLMLLALLHPFFQGIFEIVPLSLSDWGLLLMIGVMKLFAIEIAKEFILIRRQKI